MASYKALSRAIARTVLVAFCSAAICLHHASNAYSQNTESQQSPERNKDSAQSVRKVSKEEKDVWDEFNKIDLAKRAEELWRGLSGRIKPGMPTVPQMSYHVILRADNHEAKDQHTDFHFPSINPPPPDSGDLATRLFEESYRKPIDAVLADFSNTCQLVPEPNPDRADILIHINLAERAQSSQGFSYTAMTKHHSRNRERWKDAEDWEFREIRGAGIESIFALPWSFVRVHHRSLKKGESRTETIVGAEIWIEYPIRTALQEVVARRALTDRDFARKNGLGETEREIIQSFVVPHQTDLSSLYETSKGRSLKFPYARGSENLLTYAIKRFHPDEDAGSPLGGGTDPSYLSWVAAQQHANSLAGKLGHSLAVIAGGFRAGSLYVGPATGDYFDRFTSNPSGFLAAASLRPEFSHVSNATDDGLAISQGLRLCKWSQSSDRGAEPIPLLSSDTARAKEMVQKTHVSKRGEWMRDMWGLF